MRLFRTPAGRLLLATGLLLFTLAQLLHPLFHGTASALFPTAAECRFAPADDPAHGIPELPHHPDFCPICAGLLAAAELPPAPELYLRPDTAEISRTVPAAGECRNAAPFRSRAPPAA